MGYYRNKILELSGRVENSALLTKVYSQQKFNISAKQDFSGRTPNVFVGKYGYPNIRVGILGNESVSDQHG